MHEFDRALMDGHDASFKDDHCDGCGCDQPPEDFSESIYGPRCVDCCAKLARCAICGDYAEALDLNEDKNCPDCAKEALLE